MKAEGEEEANHGAGTRRAMGCVPKERKGETEARQEPLSVAAAVLWVQPAAGLARALWAWPSWA